MLGAAEIAATMLVAVNPARRHERTVATQVAIADSGARE